MRLAIPVMILAFVLMGSHWGHDPGFGYFPFWPLLIIFFFFGGFRMLAGNHHHARHHHGHGPTPSTPTAPADPALATLRDRFARGEIDRAEYEERRAILLGRQPVPAATPKGEKAEEGREWPDLI